MESEIYRKKYFKYKLKYQKLKRLQKIKGGKINDIYKFIGIVPKIKTYDFIKIHNIHKEKKFKFTAKSHLESFLGAEIIPAITKISCNEYYNFLNYRVTENDISNLVTDIYKDTILDFWYNNMNENDRPAFVNLILNTCLVPSNLSKIMSENTKTEIGVLLKGKIMDLQIIKNKLDSIKEMLGEKTQTGSGWITDMAKSACSTVGQKVKDITFLTVDKIKTTYDSIMSEKDRLLEDIKQIEEIINNTVNQNMIDAIELIFFTNKYEIDMDLWEYINVIIEFLICLYNGTIKKIKEAIINLLSWYKQASIAFASILTKLSEIIDTLNNAMDLTKLKESIKKYLDNSPISFVLLEEILNMDGTCSKLYESQIEIETETELKDLKKTRKLSDFLEPITTLKEKLYKDKGGKDYYNFVKVYMIPPSVLLLLSIKLNNTAIKKEHNYFLTTYNENNEPIINKEIQKLVGENIKSNSWSEKILLFTTTIYDSCLYLSIKEELKKELKEKKTQLKELKAESSIKSIDKLKKFFRIGKKQHISDDTISISSEIEDSIEELENLKKELERLNLLDKDILEIKNKIIRLILNAFETNIEVLHKKICNSINLEFSDFDGILNIVKNTKLTRPIIESSYIRNFIIKMLTKYTAFLPVDITIFNILNLKDDKKTKFILKYKFFEIMLQQNYGNFNYNTPFNPPEELYDYIHKKWIQFKKTI